MWNAPLYIKNFSRKCEFSWIEEGQKKKKKKRKKVKQPTSQRMRSSNWQEWSMKKSRLCGQNTPWWRDLHLSSCLQKIFCGRWTSIRNKCWQLPFLYEVWLLYIWFSCVVFCVFTLLVLSVEQPRQEWLACNATICVDKGFGFSRLFPWKVSGFQKNTPQLNSIRLVWWLLVWWLLNAWYASDDDLKEITASGRCSASWLLDESQADVAKYFSKSRTIIWRPRDWIILSSSNGCYHSKKEAIGVFGFEFTAFWDSSGFVELSDIFWPVLHTTENEFQMVFAH